MSHGVGVRRGRATPSGPSPDRTWRRAWVSAGVRGSHGQILQLTEIMRQTSGRGTSTGCGNERGRSAESRDGWSQQGDLDAEQQKRASVRARRYGRSTPLGVRRSRTVAGRGDEGACRVLSNGHGPGRIRPITGFRPQSERSGKHERAKPGPQPEQEPTEPDVLTTAETDQAVVQRVGHDVAGDGHRVAGILLVRLQLGATHDAFNRAHAEHIHAWRFRYTVSRRLVDERQNAGPDEPASQCLPYTYRLFLPAPEGPARFTRRVTGQACESKTSTPTCGLAG